jgi:hypothetical protein
VAGALAAVIVLGAVLCGCHSTQHRAAPATSLTPGTTKTTAPSATTQSVAPVVNIQPLPIRLVQRSKLVTPDKCPATNPPAPVAPTDVLTACDLARTTVYTLGPEAMQLILTRLDPPKPLTADYFEVHLTLDPASAAGWASQAADELFRLAGRPE